MQDRRLATVLGLIHQQPWHPWTVAELCSSAGLPKPCCRKNLPLLIGSSPIEYLSALAHADCGGLADGAGMSVERVAERCGYDSVPAFSKAFKRCLGMSPGAFHRAETLK